MSGERIDYPVLVRQALQGVVRAVLEQVSTEGFPGEHHLYITFGTGAPGVEMPAWLRRRYPEQMNVILQHQFWGLEVDDERFSVSLRFGGKPARLTVPFAAIEAFLDPAAEFGLKLNAPTPPGPEPATAAERPVPGAAPVPGGGGERVVSLDAFRQRDK